MRLVLDTNVLVSALLNPLGTPSHLLRAWRRAEYELVVSLPLLTKLRRVLSRPRLASHLRASGVSEEELLLDLETVATLVNPAETVSAVAKDASDNRVLEAALAGEADYIVSGDEHLLRLGELRGTAIVTAARMLAILETARREETP